MDLTRRMTSAFSAGGGGVVEEPEWPVYLTYDDYNGDVGIQLYNYLISILPEGTPIALPTTEYKIGDIIVNGWGTITMVYVMSYSKNIMMGNQNLNDESLTPSLNSTGFFS